VPFYVALPSSTIDWRISDGLSEIRIEERDQSEVTYICGRTEYGETARVRLTPDGSPARNFGFDVTPARMVSALITERGACAANEAALQSLFPDLANSA
jgi:methylthioribose-1-phosphate isomerase